LAGARILTVKRGSWRALTSLGLWRRACTFPRSVGENLVGGEFRKAEVEIGEVLDGLRLTRRSLLDAQQKPVVFSRCGRSKERLINKKKTDEVCGNTIRMPEEKRDEDVPKNTALMKGGKRILQKKKRVEREHGRNTFFDDDSRGSSIQRGKRRSRSELRRNKDGLESMI